MIVALLTANNAIWAFQEPAKVETPLQILHAGVERSEDAPFVSADFHFLPGDFVYFQFQVSGFAVQASENNEIRKMSLTYQASLQDSQGVPLAPAVASAIKEDLGTEDKNWTPKRRASFLLPAFISAGAFHLRISVKDLIGNTSVERDIPFQIGGIAVVPSEKLGVQDFQFFRTEEAADALELPAFRPGDTVYARFNMVGFTLAAGNRYHLSYGLIVTRPDGQPYLTMPSAAELSADSFYPVPFVPGTLNITTSRTAARGQYVISLSVRDLSGNQTYRLKRAFTVE